MLDVIAGLAATKTGLDLIKGARELLKGDKIDREKILERLSALQEALYQAREALGDAQEENRRLKAQVAETDRLHNITADLFMVPDYQFYIRLTEKSAGQNIPYCPICWGETQKLIPLVPTSNNGYNCMLHKVRFDAKAERNRSPVRNLTRG